MDTNEAQVARVREVLGYFIRISGLRRREIEERLRKAGRGVDLSRLLSSRVDLKLRHILDICGVIGIYPQELFDFVFHQGEQRSPLAQRLDGLLTAGRGTAGGAARGSAARQPAGELEEMSRLLGEVLRRLDRLPPPAAGPPRGR